MRSLMKNRRILGLAVIATVCGIVWMVSAGNLYPPAPPSSTMKTLEEVHTAVQALRGAAPKVASPIITSDLFLEVSEIPGNSTDLRHPQWIDLSGFMVNVANGAEVDGKPNPLFSGVYISKFQDNASVPLMLKCCDNQPIELITLEAVKPTSMNPFAYYRLRLWNARVAFVEPFSAANEGREVIAFTDFTRIEWSFRPTSTAEWQVQGWEINKQGGES